MWDMWVLWECECVVWGEGGCIYRVNLSVCARRVLEWHPAISFSATFLDDEFSQEAGVRLAEKAQQSSCLFPSQHSGSGSIQPQPAFYMGAQDPSYILTIAVNIFIYCAFNSDWEVSFFVY